MATRYPQLLLRSFAATSTRTNALRAVPFVSFHSNVPSASTVAVPASPARTSTSASSQLHSSAMKQSLEHAGRTARNGVVPSDGTSSVSGELFPPLIEQTLGDFFSNLVRLYPTSPALISRHESPHVHRSDYAGGVHGENCLRWDFAEFDDNINALARGLLK